METSASMPIGYRFKPTDQELVSHYLNHKLLGNDSIVNNIIPHVQLLNHAPWDLPALSKSKSNDSECFFFTCHGLMKFNKSKTRFDRQTKTKEGYWKITGKDRKIKTKGTNIVIGTKKTLVFYGNQHEKTNWVMHEYHSTFPDNKKNLVLCRLMRKVEEEIEGVTHSSCHVAACDFEEQSRVDLTRCKKPLHIPKIMPIGYRFHPTNEELLKFYLERKLVGNDSIVNNITEIDLDIIPPWKLPALLKVNSDDSECFFFTSLGLKFKKGMKCKRKNRYGYWKITGKKLQIKSKGTNNVIGTKRILVFYRGHEKTNWVIHEYHAINKGKFVLCRLMKKDDKKTEGVTYTSIYDEEETHSSNHVEAADFENQTTMDSTPYVSGSPEVNIESMFQASSQKKEYSLLATDQTLYFQGIKSSYAYVENENSTVGFPVETSEDDIADYGSWIQTPPGYSYDSTA